MGLITEYKCPSCGAPLSFDAESGQVKCQNCGNEYEVGTIVDAQKVDEANTTSFDWGDYKTHLKQEDFAGLSVYKCQSCGAEIETTATTAATKCPYCDNNVVLMDRVSGGLKPNVVIPFAIDKKQLPGIMDNFYKSKKYLPRDFFSQSVIERAQGVYIPFWLFDCTISGNCSYNSESSTYTETPRERITTTRRYLHERGGRMQFSNVPVDASEKMDNDLMDSIEPYDYSKMVPYDSSYLTGFVADRFDRDPDEELPRANVRTLQSANAVMRGTVNGGATLRYSNLKMEKASVKYALLPAYVFNCEYKGQRYRYCVNGQTGKVVADLPIDKGLTRKRFLTVGAIAFVIVAAIAALIL